MVLLCLVLMVPAAAAGLVASSSSWPPRTTSAETNSAAVAAAATPPLLSVHEICLVALVLLLIVGITLLGLHRLARGAATLDDMVHDVQQAIAFVKANQETCGIVLNRPGQKQVFGGYSSGGHVAAVLLERQAEQMAREFDGILYVSGVLAVRPDDDDDGDDEDSRLGRRLLATKPRFLTDFVLRAVWGETGQHAIPSPLASRRVVDLPHLLVACRHEVFGLSWLDIFLCSEAYHEKLLALNIPSTLRHIRSDHWFILSSREFRNALAQELGTLCSAPPSLDVMKQPQTKAKFADANPVSMTSQSSASSSSSGED